jgi:hypothetical protein
MMERDVQAALSSLTLLVDSTKRAAPLDLLHSYAPVMALCADLRKAAREYNGTCNITIVIGEVENHMAALAGIFPSWGLPPDQHRVGARAAIMKLAMPTCFGAQSAGVSEERQK